MYLEYDLYKKGRQSRNFGFLSAFTLDLRSSSGIRRLFGNCVISLVIFIRCTGKFVCVNFHLFLIVDRKKKEK